MLRRYWLPSKGLSAVLLCIPLACTPVQPITTKAADLRSGGALEGLIYFLPRSYVKIVSEDTGALDVQVFNFADPKSELVLEAQYVPGSSDNIEFRVDADGLLNTASNNSRDPVGDAFRDFSRTFGAPGVPELSSASGGRSLRPLSGVAPKARPSSLAKAVPAAHGEMSETVVSARDAITAEPAGEGRATKSLASATGGGTSKAAPPVTVLLDPFAPRQRHLNGMEIHFHFIDPTVLARLAALPERRALCPRDASVCVPTVTPLEVHIKTATDTHWHVVSVVDPTRVYGIRLDRRPCVRVANRLVLNDGIVHAYNVEKPSEVAGCLTIPLEIISTIISAPFAALRRQTAILEAERARVQAELSLLGTQSQLFRAREEESLD